VKLSEWIQQTNKFLRHAGQKLSSEIVEELGDSQRFLLLDFDTQTLFTATLGMNDCKQVPKVSTALRQPHRCKFGMISAAPLPVREPATVSKWRSVLMPIGR
jgi:hypothetical protein